MGVLQRLRKQLYTDDPARRAQELSWLWSLAKQYRGAMVRVALLSLGATVLGLWGSVASKYAIDAVIGHDTRLLLTGGGMFVLALLGGLVLSYISARYTARLHVRSRHRLQHRIFDNILKAQWESLEACRSGDLLSRLHADVQTVADGVISFLPAVAGNLLRLLGAFGIILFFEPAMALLALAGAPVGLLLGRVLSRRMHNYSRKMKDQSGQLMAFQEDALRNLTSIKAFSLTDRFSRSLGHLQSSYEKTVLEATAFQAGMSAGLSLTGMVVTGVCLGYGIIRLWQGSFTYGSLTMFIQLASMLRSALSGLLSQLYSAISLLTSAGRLLTVEELPREQLQIPQGLDREDSLTLQLEQASFAYQNGIPVLHPFDLTARPGEMIAITGPSGEGKTTLLRILLGLVSPQSGSARLLGGTGADYPLSPGTRLAFSYVPQGNSIFTGTVAENLRLVRPDASEEELWQVLEAAQAKEFVAQLPGKLDHPLGVGGKGLSEGQAQRISIARALLRRAPILLLDEATSALDLNTESQVLRNLRESGLVNTCILVTHRIASAASCDRGYRILDGYVTETGKENP